MLRLVAPGMAVLAVTFGMARYGYGLFVPYLRSDFGLTTERIGLLAAGSTVGYLVATTAVPLLTARGGPRLPVVAGSLMAAAGSSAVALAEDTSTLMIGVVLAGASPALAYPPLADAIERQVAPQRRDRALALVSSGTSYGVLLAGPVALVAGEEWRRAWLAFGVLAVAVAAWNAIVLPGADPDRRPVIRSTKGLASRAARPLLASGFLVGVGLAVYFTFAVDLVVSAGALPASAGPAVLVTIGVAGLLGGLVGELTVRLGLRCTLRLTALGLAVALILLPVAPGSLTAVVASALLFGVGFISHTGALAIWSARAFPQHPDTGLAGMLFLLFAGQLVGPAIAGLIGGSYGLAPTFYASALLVGTIALLVSDAPVDGPVGPGAR